MHFSKKKGLFDTIHSPFVGQENPSTPPTLLILESAEWYP